MSIYFKKTAAAPSNRFGRVHYENAKKAAVKKVRCSILEGNGIVESVRVALEEHNFELTKELTYFINMGDLYDQEIVTIMEDAQQIVHSLTPKFQDLVYALLSVKWKERGLDATKAYFEFTVEILIAQSVFIPLGISILILNWIPEYKESGEWTVTNGSPSKRVLAELEHVHGSLNRILTAVPMAFDTVIDEIQRKFPYLKRPGHFTVGYIHNILWLMKSQPLYEELLLKMILQKLLLLDVELSEEFEKLREEVDNEPDEIFQMDDINSIPKQAQPKPVEHPFFRTLDTCLYKVLNFLEDKFRPILNTNNGPNLAQKRFFKTLIQIFNDVLFLIDKPNHIQFVIFHVCSIHPAYSKAFLNFLWLKVKDPNVVQPLRHNAVSYLASFLARAKFVSLGTITYYLQELSKWANTYLNDSDRFTAKISSLKINEAFFSVCQAMFYLIAFHARALTRDDKILKVLHRLQLSRLVTCHLNPLRYCLPTVVTAFAAVARAHHLAYCYTVMERNARRTMSIFDGDEELKPDATIDTYFPFDPYVLPLSGEYIEPNYLKYDVPDLNESAVNLTSEIMRRKRRHSESLEEDDFLPPDKQQKLSDLSNSELFDQKYYYGTSPGFSQ